jgi:hypothetical protein
MRSYSAAHGILPVLPFQFADGKVRLGHILEVVDEKQIDRGSSGRPHNWQRLRRDLLGHHHAEAGRDLGNQPHKHWSAFLGYAAFADKRDRLGHRFRQSCSNGIIRSFGAIVLSGAACEREDLKAGQPDLRRTQVLTCSLSDRGDGPKHDRC